MYVSTLLTFMAIGGFPSFVEDMKVLDFPSVYFHLRGFWEVLPIINIFFSHCCFRYLEESD